MELLRRLSVAALLLFGLSQHTSARAETFNTCAGFIETLPATIGTQGVWCLRHDLSTAITSGAAITVATNNVTIDCNDFKVGGLAAGPDSLASGIKSSGRNNVTVRNCSLRGYLIGIDIDGGGGHLVEDNRLDNNYHIGIALFGDTSVVRGNRVFDTGGNSISGSGGIISSAIGIAVRDADVLDNLVDGVIDMMGFSSDFSIGIAASTATHGTLVRNNRIRNLTTVDGSKLAGIYVVNNSSAVLLDSNLFGPPSAYFGAIDANGIWLNGSSGTCTNNTFFGTWGNQLRNCP